MKRSVRQNGKKNSSEREKILKILSLLPEFLPGLLPTLSPPKWWFGLLLHFEQ
jgi:hypothetical protein